MSYNVKVNINQDNPEWSDDVLTVKEFLDCVNCSGFIDYDGWGYPAKDGYYDRSIVIKPSKVNSNLPKDATHIVWFNR